MEEILVLGLVVLAFIGSLVVHLLKRILLTLGEIRDNLPDKNFPIDPERGTNARNAFWKEVYSSVNRLTNIHNKFVLGEDLLAESQKMREKWERLRKHNHTGEFNEGTSGSSAQGVQHSDAYEKSDVPGQ